MYIKKFKDFLFEEQRHKPVDHIEKQEISDGSDPDLEKEAEDFITDEEENCPRCSERYEDCKCPSDDPWSTQVYHRAPKGEIVKGKPKQNFKQK